MSHFLIQSWNYLVTCYILLTNGFVVWSQTEIRVSDRDLPIFSIDDGSCMEKIKSLEGSMSDGKRRSNI